MVAILPSIYCSEESLSIRGICARYRGHPARARRGQNNGSVAWPAECFRDGARAIGTFPGKHWAVRCRTTAVQSPCHHFCLEQLRLQREVEVMQLVSYNLCSLAFAFILYRSRSSH